jgi:alkylation response protein AidB-like acyl-CoA dehydrogenase
METTATIEGAKALAQQFATRAAAADRQGVLPLEDVQSLREAGFFALSVPKDHGGLGLSLGECVAAQLELAQGSASSALVTAMPLHVFGHAREIQPWPEAMFAQLCHDAVHAGA